MTEFEFEWDESKNASNERKHGVLFEEFKTIFADDFARLIQDPDHWHEEERYSNQGLQADAATPHR